MPRKSKAETNENAAKSSVNKSSSETSVIDGESEITEKCGTDLIQYDPINKSVRIFFYKIFEQLDKEDKNSINDFYIRKRSFSTNIDKVIETIDRIFNSSDKSDVLQYLRCRWLIYQNEHQEEYPDSQFPEDEFLDMILNDILSKDVRKYIDWYIEHDYSYNLDANANKSTKVNQELQFTDNHAKILMKAAEGIRYVLPLINHYGGIEADDNYFYRMFVKIINSFTPPDCNILNKIYKFTYSRVVSTNYSDRSIWSLLNSMGKDTNTLTFELCKEIIIIIYRTVKTKNIINFFDVVIGNKIMFAFRRNYKVTFKPINLNNVDSEGLTNFDKMDIALDKTNEAKAIINKHAIDYQITNILLDLGLDLITKDELDYYRSKVCINEIQTNFLFLFFAKYMGSYNNLYNCDKNSYITLLIILYKWLQLNKFTLLPKYLIGRPGDSSEKRIGSKSKIVGKILENKNYKRLNNSKFKYSINNILDVNLVIKIIGNLSINKFTTITPYNSNEKDGEEIELNIELLSDEVINFILMI